MGFTVGGLLGGRDVMRRGTLVNRSLTMSSCRILWLTDWKKHWCSVVTWQGSTSHGCVSLRLKDISKVFRQMLSAMQSGKMVLVGAKVKFGIDEIFWPLASTSGKMPQRGHRTSQITFGSAEFMQEHLSNQHSPAALQLVKHTPMTHSEHPEICKITTLVSHLDYTADRKLLSINSG